ncbi:MAG: adenylate/guanylate cyclase domain-containing protein [Steroidobacteraceae bacterium]
MNRGKHETRYVRSGDVHIAFQVVGDGPIDLVFVPGFVSHLEYQWELPACARLLERLASFTRLILFDKRGTGLSDRVLEVPTLEQRMDDVRVVMDAVGSARAAVLGVSEGGPMSALFAATYPDRTSALVLYGSFARIAWAKDHPFGRKPEDYEDRLVKFGRAWGSGAMVESFAPSGAGDATLRQWWGNFERLSASPGAMLAVQRMNYEIDARHVLPLIQTPTLVMHRAGDCVVKVEHGRYLAQHIPDAQFVELPGEDHVPFAGDSEAITNRIQEFLAGAPCEVEPERMLATLLFTDIAGSTERAASLSDRRWRDLLAQHHAAVRRELARFRGWEIETAGDGFLAAFDGPARAVRCADAIRKAIASLGIELRAGLHTGEVEQTGDKIGGIAVHIGARVAAEARPGEVLVSHTVKDLVAGSGLQFTDRGVHALKGVGGEWRFFALGTPAP